MWTCWVFWEFPHIGYFSIHLISKFFTIFPPFRPDRGDTFMRIASENVPKWSNPQESILKPKLQAVRHYKTRFHYIVCLSWLLWIIFDLDFYSLSEFRGQGKITLNSLAFCLTKVFCTCVGSGLTTFQKKKLFHAPRDWYMGGSTTH
jgi:hypothetical protein